MDEHEIKKIFDHMESHLNERQLRLLTAAVAEALGYGGTSKLSRITGISRNTIMSGRKDLDTPEELSEDSDVSRVRKKGGGRKKISNYSGTMIDTGNRNSQDVSSAVD